jgi:hypothetical protein
MKALLVLVLAIAVGYVAYNFAYTPVMDALGIDRQRPQPKQEVAVVVPKPEPKPEPKSEPKPEPMPEPKPEMKPEPAPPPPPPEPAKPKEGEFVPPTFDPVEVVTANWTAIPKGYFATPKPIKVTKALTIEMRVGAGTATTNVPAGGTVFAIAQEGANLIIAPAAGSPGRAQVPMEDTDIKEVFTAAYENIKITSTERARLAFEAKKIAATKPKGASKASAGGTGSNAKPERSEDGTYPLLLASMKSGEVTEVKPDNIKSWGDITSEKIEDVTYWTVVVKYETQTMFGKFETEAQARIKDGKVAKWVYVGSGEVVP